MECQTSVVVATWTLGRVPTSHGIHSGSQVLGKRAVLHCRVHNSYACSADVWGCRAMGDDPMKSTQHTREVTIESDASVGSVLLFRFVHPPPCETKSLTPDLKPTTPVSLSFQGICNLLRDLRCAPYQTKHHVSNSGSKA